MARFSLKWLFVGIGFIALAFAALVNANSWWLLGFEQLMVLSAFVTLTYGWIKGHAGMGCFGLALVVQALFSAMFSLNVSEDTHTNLLVSLTSTLAPDIGDTYYVRQLLFLQWQFLFALVGGCFGQWLARGKTRREEGLAK